MAVRIYVDLALFFAFDLQAEMSRWAVVIFHDILFCADGHSNSYIHDPEFLSYGAEPSSYLILAKDYDYDCDCPLERYAVSRNFYRSHNCNHRGDKLLDFVLRLNGRLTLL
jgi:hypothetical protein